MEAFRADYSKGGAKPRNRYLQEGLEPSSPMARYSAYRGKRSSWTPPWGSTACVVTAEDGTFGFGVYPRAQSLRIQQEEQAIEQAEEDELAVRRPARSRPQKKKRTRTS